MNEQRTEKNKEEIKTLIYNTNYNSESTINFYGMAQIRYTLRRFVLTITRSEVHKSPRLTIIQHERTMF